MPTVVEQPQTPFDHSSHFHQQFANILKIQREEEDDEEGGMEEVQQQQQQQEVEEEDEDQEFSFMCGGANSSPIAAEDAFINGQIKPVFPFFSGEDLPMRPPVKKVFVETTTTQPAAAVASSSSSGEWSNRKAIEASPEPEVCKKSNSTGFSKIRRFRDFLGRSNSDGRDAFIFLNNNSSQHQSADQEKATKKENSNGKVSVQGKANKAKADAAGKKGKTAALSPHEAYLKSRAKEEDRRRSYLPYRPELMGFFTNVNGGLSKNVHPF